MCLFAPTQQITTAVTLLSTQRWSTTTTFMADAKLTTPFERLSSLSLHTEGTRKTESGSGNMKLEFNGEKMLAVSGELSTKTKMEASLTFSQPRPMTFTVSGSQDDLDVYLNWDRCIISTVSLLLHYILAIFSMI